MEANITHKEHVWLVFILAGACVCVCVYLMCTVDGQDKSNSHLFSTLPVIWAKVLLEEAEAEICCKQDLNRIFHSIQRFF